MDVCMLLGKEAHQDPRVKKEAATLSQAGFSVGVIGLTAAQTTDWARDPAGYALRHVREEGPVRSALKNRLKTVAPSGLARLQRLGRRLRGIPQRPPGPHNEAQDPGQNLEELRLLRHATLNAGLVTDGIRSRTLALAAVAARPRAIHAHDLDTLRAAAWAARMTGAALVYDAHEIWWAQHPDGEAPDRWVSYYKTIEERLIGNADAVITVCDSIADFLATTHGAVRPAIVRNTIDQSAQPGPELDELKSTSTPVEVLYHGGFNPDRGIEELVKAAALFKGAQLVLRGSGALEPALLAQIDRQGMAGQVRIEPPVPWPDVVRAAARADIGIIPYRPTSLNNRFSTPNKLFEYMSAGLAVAASDLPEIRRVVRDEDIGAVFDPDRPESIADAVNTLAADPSRLTGMRQRAVAAARAQYNWDVDGKVLVDVYRAVFARSAPAIIRRVVLGTPTPARRPS